jgi:hypothetical protein
VSGRKFRSTRVAADSFDARAGNGQGKGPTAQPLTLKAQSYATVLSPRHAEADPTEQRDKKKLEVSLAFAGANRIISDSSNASGYI